MKRKFKKSISILLFLALIAASIPSTLALAEREGKKGERYEHEEHEYEGKEHEEKEYSEKQRKKENYSTPAPNNGGSTIPAVPAAPATTNKAPVGFSDNEKVTISFPEGNSIQSVVHLKQGKLYIPLESVLETLKVPFVRYPKGTIVEGFANGKQFIFHADKRTMYLDGQKKNIGAAAFVESNQFYVPLQAVADAFGRTTVTNPQKQTIQFR